MIKSLIFIVQCIYFVYPSTIFQNHLYHPLKVEKQLREILPMERANDFCHRLVLHGRDVCVANRPNCEACCMKSFCSFALGEIENPGPKKKTASQAKKPAAKQKATK